MNREGYLETLRNHYADDIKEAYFECEHQMGSNVDIPLLNEKLAALLQCAEKEGLPAQDFDVLVKGILPDLYAELSYSVQKKQAA